MSAPAAWLADPTGRHQLRYWNGTAWTDFVSDGGVQSNDPVAGPPAQQGAWMDKVKATAAQAAVATSAAVDQTAAALNQQTQQWQQGNQQATAQPTQAQPTEAPAPTPVVAAPVEQAPAPAPVNEAAIAEAMATPASSIADQLHKLADLRDRGVLTDDEFQVQKMKVINS